MDLGFRIALDVIGVYGCLGPFVCLLLYIIFDRLAEQEMTIHQEKNVASKDPALWSSRDIDAYFEEKMLWKR